MLSRTPMFDWVKRNVTALIAHTPNRPVSARATSAWRRSLSPTACTAHCIVTRESSSVNSAMVPGVSGIVAPSGSQGVPSASALDRLER